MKCNYVRYVMLLMYYVICKLYNVSKLEYPTDTQITYFHR